MPDVIFLVHGMGEFDDKWTTPIVDELRTFCENYSGSSIPFDQRFKFIGINYSAIFKDILSTWAEQKEGIEDLVQTMSVELVEKLLGWIAGSNAIEKDFLWTHAFDVVTYRLLPTVREAVKVRIALQLFQGINGLSTNASWSVIAHSLGTAVAHDTLHTWYTQPLAGGVTLGQLRAPRVLQMVSNVSRILQTKPKVLEDSTVRPGMACDYYFTAHHPLDPFTLIRPFLPVQWPGGPAQDRYYAAVVEHDYIQQLNIHELSHYLRHPDVLLPLLRCLTFDTFITKANEKAYREQFKLHDDFADSDLIAVRKALEDLGVTLPDHWTAILEAWKWFRDLNGGDDDDV